MNRIERMLWEEEQIKAIEPEKRGTRETTVKAVSLVLLAVVVAFLATRPWPAPGQAGAQPPIAKSAVATSLAVPNRADQVGPPAPPSVDHLVTPARPTGP